MHFAEPNTETRLSDGAAVLPAADLRRSALWRWLPHRNWGGAALLLLIVFLIGNIHLVSGSQAPIWDAESFFIPAFTLVADHARAGRIALWNPWESAGTPEHAEPELGTSSPFTVIVGAIVGGTEAGFRYYWLCFWFLGPLGVLLFARHLGAPPWAGLVAALGFMFCGFYTSHAEHTSSLYSLSFVPLVLWRFDSALVSRRIRPAAEAGALWGVSALGGYPQLTILTGGFVLLWGLGRWWARHEDLVGDQPGTLAAFAGVDLPHMVLSLAVLFSVGTVVLSPAYAPFFTEGHGYSDRVGVRSREEAISSNMMDVGALATFSSPYLNDLKVYGNTTLWPTSDGSMTDIYVGSLVTIFALLALVVCPKSKFRWWLAGLVLFSIACALGRTLPVRGWLYDVCIPTRYFRNPALFRAYAIVTAVVLAICAATDLQRAIAIGSARIWKTFLITATYVTTCAFAAYLAVMTHVEHIGPRWRVANLHFALVWFGAAGIALLCAKSSRVRRIFPALVVLLAVTDAIFTIRLSRPLVSSDKHARITWSRINAAHDPSIHLTSHGLQREFRPPNWIGATDNNENVPMKIATFANYVTMRNRFYSDFLIRPVLRDMSTGSDRIWFSGDALQVVPTDTFYDAFVKRTENLGSPVLLLHAPKEMRHIRDRGLQTATDQATILAISQLSPAQRVHADVVSYTPNLLRLKVNCPADGWLLVTDRWTAGWRATVNGRATEVFGGDFLFRAVRVQAGTNEVEFSYHPFGWPVLLIVSWGTLAGVAVLATIRVAQPAI